MCCLLKEEIINNIRQRAKEGKIVVYKAVTVKIRKGEPFVRSEMGNYTWHVGINKACLRSSLRHLSLDYKYDIVKPSGIHGFTNKQEAQRYADRYGCTFVPIVCDIKDLITAGPGSVIRGPGSIVKYTRYQAVFLKAELTQADWDEFIVPATKKIISRLWLYGGKRNLKHLPRR